MKMKIKFLPIILLFFAFQSCELQREDFEKITPDQFFQTENDARLAVNGLYEPMRPLFQERAGSIGMFSDISAGDIMRGMVGTWQDQSLYHLWTPENGAGTEVFFKYYNHVSKARNVAQEIEKMDIQEETKRQLMAEAHAIAGWVAFILYDAYGPIPYPTDEMLENPQEVQYPERPTNEEMVTIIEGLFSDREQLMDPDFGAQFGRMNKGIAQFILMELYMLEAGRTGNAEFYSKAQDMAEEMIGSGFYELQDNYSDVFSLSNKRNKEVIYAPASNYEFGGAMWHAHHLPNNFDSDLTNSVGSWAVFRMLWSFYDAFDKDDYRLDGIV